ncbi:MAG: ABC transporter permease [Pseudomonadota bacterium]
MFGSYLQVAFNWILRQPFYYVVKVLSLAIGVGCGALFFAHYQYILGFDRHIDNFDNTYRVLTAFTSPETGERVRPYYNSGAIVDPVRNEYRDQLLYMGSLLRRTEMFTRGEQNIVQEFMLAEPDIPRIFDLDYVAGDPRTALDGPGRMAISETAARRHFGSVQAVGQTVTVRDDFSLEVSGVFRDLPETANMQFEVLVSEETGPRLYGEDFMSDRRWSVYTGYLVYASFEDQRQAQSVIDDLETFVERRAPEQQMVRLQEVQLGISLQPLSEIYLNPLNGGFNGMDYTRRNTFLGLLGFAVLVVLAGFINYISLTLAQARLRRREMGVRLAFGATRRQIVGQYAIESLLVSIPALLLAIAFLYFIIPVFSAVTDSGLTVVDAVSPGVLTVMAVAIVVVCAVSCIAPVAFLRSAYIAGILSGSDQRSTLRQHSGAAIVFGQFAFSTLLCLVVLGIYLQIEYLEELEMGLEPDNLLILDNNYSSRDPDAFSYQGLYNELLALPGVASIGPSSLAPPRTGNFTGWAHSAGDGVTEVDVSHAFIGPGFLEAYGIELLAGRDFSQEFPGDFHERDINGRQDMGILLTERAVRRFGLPSPQEAVGTQFRSVFNPDDTNTYRVIGVIENFRYNVAESPIRSLALLRGSAQPQRNFGIRLDPAAADIERTVQQIDAIWSRHVPELPPDHQFMDQIMAEQIAEMSEDLSMTALIAAAVSFTIAVFGIYAQASYVCERRAREISIRRVLGGSVPSILLLLVRSFIVPVVLSFVVAVPLAWYLLQRYYASFPETVGFPLQWYIPALVLIIVLASATVLSQCYRLAMRNPIHAIKYE